MTDLERRALLGDREAQGECTRQGIVLPCPFCGGQAQMESSPTLTAIRPSIEGLSGGELAETERYRYNIHCKNCGNACKKMGYGGRATKSFETKSAALAAWNTRQAPPLGRCETCSRREAEYVSETCDGEKLYDCELMYEPVSLSGFCDGYKSEEEEN